jgi:hypothetical protein
MYVELGDKLTIGREGSVCDGANTIDSYPTVVVYLLMPASNNVVGICLVDIGNGHYHVA